MRNTKSNIPCNSLSIQYAICSENTEYPAFLEILNLFRVLRDQDAERDGAVRVIDESGEDYLYPANYFIAVDLPPQTLRR